MKINVQVEVPDDEDCSKCKYNNEDYRCSIFGGYHMSPCPACIEARKGGEKK